MDNFDIKYKRALSKVEEIIRKECNDLPGMVDANPNTIEKNSSSLDAWDYCYAIAIGLAGIFISTNEKFGKYLADIHKAASGSSGEYSLLQSILGKTFYHSGDFIDSVNGTFINRNGDNAYALFHRLLWGHDIFSLGEDNPFKLMFQQKGIFGILQAVRHLIADTASKQGLPLPGSSFFDVVDKENKTSNYIIKIAQQLSEESIGNKAKAQEIYSHIATIRAQNITAGVVVKAISELYFKLRGVTDDIRCCEIRFIAYSVNFFGDAVLGCVRQKGVPYINTPLAIAMGTSFARLCYINNREIKQLERTTNELSAQTQIFFSEKNQDIISLSEVHSVDDIIKSYQQAEENIKNLKDFFGEDE